MLEGITDIETNIGIFIGLVIGGLDSIVISIFNGSTATALVGGTAIILAVCWFVSIAISFNTGMHSRRV